MSRRSHHLTELGCIACEDLAEFGAGKEGWLAPDAGTTVLCAIDAHSIAIANRSLVLILGWSDPDEQRVKIRPELSPIEAERITTIEWLVFDDIKVIAVGTSRGFLLIYSLRGDLIHRQMVYHGQIIKLRVRGTKKDQMQDISSGDVCVVMPGVIARFDGSDIQSMLQRWFQDTHSRFWDEKPNKDPEDDENSHGRLPYQLWNVSKYGSCVDAAITGIIPPPLMELQSSQRYYCAVTIGDDAVISAFRLSVDRKRNQKRSFNHLLENLLDKLLMSWFMPASALTCLKDHPRKGEKLTLSPSGTLAAITDSLGRILLLDTQALVVVRLWKGYRDANCFFMEMLVNRDDKHPSSSHHAPGKSDYCLCLAIHAPRKGVIEVWQMRTGPRLLALNCAKGCRLLQPTYRFGSLSDSPYVPLEVFLLNGDSGQLSVLNRLLN
ncbi:hypothetical protein V6N12_054700 [Hibiscus sabdariffa]|uniref:Rab3-GAP regulatory subunit N-terminal domain-containing protein n=1 Tax=Hibiscus sabdariffa TaxID=183260 RepID=A0ABR2D1J3_9ROSI